MEDYAGTEYRVLRIMVAAMYGKLRILSEGQLLQEYLLTSDEVTIGRAGTNHVVLNSPYVSRQQARLSRQGTRWLLENLSGNVPIAMGGATIAGPVSLGNGDQFEVGGFVVQVVVAQQAPSEPATAAMPAPSASGNLPPTVLSSSSNPPVVKVSYGTTVAEYALIQPHITIGRASDNGIVIPLGTVSRHHATLNLGAQGYIITDQHSTNGLLYKGAKVTQLALSDGDIIRISDELGNFATLSYSDPSRPAVVTHETGVRLKPDQHEITIGRAPDNVVVLNYPQVSAHHAVIRREQDGAVLQDLGSTNGTFVHGQRITRTPIKPGDVLLVAGYQLVYQADGIAPIEADRVRIDAFNLRKTVGDGLVLLHDLSLSIQPKELVAVVGGSGSGKSTCMDALNGFRPAPEGRVLLNGDDYYQNFASYRSSLGYVPQDDIIHRELTVERTLYYAAKLRLPQDLSEAEIEQRIADVLNDVEMSAFRASQVSRLSGGQRKRVSIAVELLSKPTLFFLDEPTTGLDPGLDKRMMSLLRRLADQGRTIVLVTHATENITVCDQVIFLARGGRLCFYGPPQEALRFFGVQAFTDIYAKIQESETSGEEWETRYKQSPYYQRYVQDRLAEVSSPSGASRSPAAAPPAGAAPKKPRASWLRQFLLLTQRYVQIVQRDRANLGIMLAQAPIIGIIIAMVAGSAVFANGNEPADAQKVLFLLAIAGVLLGANNAAREITKESPIYLRERLVNLRVVPYVLSKVVVLALIGLVQSALLVGVVAVRTGIPHTGVLLPGIIELMIGVWLTTMGGLSMGLLVSALASSSDKATSIIPLILVPQVILAGLIFPLKGPTEVLSYAVVTRWSTDSLGSTADLNRLYYQSLSSGPPGFRTSYAPSLKERFELRNYDRETTIREDYSVQAHQASRRAHLLTRWGILAGMSLFFLVLTCFFQKRKDRRWKVR